MIEESGKAYCPYCGSNKVYILQPATVGYRVGEVIVKRKGTESRRLEFDYDTDQSISIERFDDDTVGFKCDDCSEIFSVPEIQTKPENLSPLESFVYNWDETRFESGIVKSDEFIRFAREMKQALKETVPDFLEITKYYVGHFYINLFIKNKVTCKYVNFFTSDVRFFHNWWVDKNVIRTAENDEDHKGGRNKEIKLVEIFETAELLTS